jgi:hypothetical protein
MSKFVKPKPAAVTQADINRVIEGADAVDDRPTAKETRFTMTLDAEMTAQIDRARKATGRLTRLAWLRQAAAEKLERDGF